MDVLDLEKDLELKKAQDEIERLKNIVAKLQVLLKESGIESEGIDVPTEEIICIREIDRLEELSATCGLDMNEVKTLETLVKTLLQIRAKNPRQVKKNLTKGMETADLLAIARGKDE